MILKNPLSPANAGMIGAEWVYAAFGIAPRRTFSGIES